MLFFWKKLSDILKDLFVLLRPYLTYVLIGVCLLAGTIYLLKRDRTDFIDTIKKIQSDHDETVKKIISANEEERKAHEANLKRLEDTLDQIQRKHEEDLRTLEINKTRQVKQIVDTFDQDPTAAAKQISQATGLQLVMPEEKK